MNHPLGSKVYTAMSGQFLGYLIGFSVCRITGQTIYRVAQDKVTGENAQDFSGFALAIMPAHNFGVPAKTGQVIRGKIQSPVAA